MRRSGASSRRLDPLPVPRSVAQDVSSFASTSHETRVLGSRDRGEKKNKIASHKSLTRSTMTPSAYANHRGSLETSLSMNAVSHRGPVKIIELYSLADAGGSGNNADCAVPMDEPIFQPIPHVVEIPHFRPMEPIEVTLSFRNNDRFSRRLQVVPPSVPWLRLFREPRREDKLSSSLGGSSGGGSVAPGMEIRYRIVFTADTKSDYAYDIVCITEREKFLVPVRATGGRAVLDFPDVVDFGVVPVKYPNVRSFSVQNLGDAPANFTLFTEEPFSISPTQASVNVGEFLQVQIQFFPSVSHQAYERLLEIAYDSGETCVTRLSGSAEDLFVMLSGNSMTLPSTFITRSTRRRLKLSNKSNKRVFYKWKSLATSEEEEQSRARRLSVVDLQEDSELNSLEMMGGSDLDLSLIRNRYQSERRALEEHDFPFEDDTFAIEPSEGELHAGGETEFTVIFAPLISGQYERTAFLDVSGREIRLPLQLTAEGTGPDLSFSYAAVDLGDVFIHSSREYRFILENRGDIDGRYQYCPSDSPCVRCFHFTPDCGVLAAGDQQVITCSFCSDHLLSFDEDLAWFIEGQTDPIYMRMKGRVVGPKVHFDRDVVDFGEVSHGFLSSETVTLFNDSDVPFEYVIRVPIDQTSGNAKNEFDIFPRNGKLVPGGDVRITVDFIPSVSKRYIEELHVDIVDVAENVASVPIKANVTVPRLTIASEELQCGDALVGDKKTLSTFLRNTSSLRLRFEIQLPSSDAVDLVSSMDRGILNPFQEIEWNLDVTARALGKQYLPIYFHVVGADFDPTCLVLELTGVGPDVVVEKHEISWGKVSVLTPVEHRLPIINRSCVAAPFSVSFESTDSVFSVLSSETLIPPLSSLQLIVQCICDEVKSFVDALVISVENADDIIVCLSASGHGSLLVSSVPLDRLYLGSHFTSHPIEFPFTIENHGRHSRSLQWSTMKPKGSSSSSPVTPDIFSIQPDRATIAPKSAIDFVVVGMSESTTGLLEARFTGKVSVGRASSNAYDLVVCADVGKPLLEFSSPVLRYSWFFDPESAVVDMLTEKLSIKNVSVLPLSFVIRTQPPFSTDREIVSLQPQESVDVNVECDPHYKSDRISHVVKQKLTIVYEDHPQRDSVGLVADISFPNLELQSDRVEFGCVMNESEKSVGLVARNTSKVPASYRWNLSIADSEGDEGSSDLLDVLARSFDILPLYNTLSPGCEEVIQFVFLGCEKNVEFRNVLAVCEVEGGPTYSVELSGSSADVSFTVDKKEIDFGPILFDRSIDGDFVIRNTSPVPLQFTIDISSLIRPSSVSLKVESGRILGNESRKISFSFAPCVPDLVDEVIFVRVAHFDPVPVRLRAIGVFPRIALSLPRLESDSFDQFYESTKNFLMSNSILEEYQIPESSFRELLRRPQTSSSTGPGLASRSSNGNREGNTGVNSSTVAPMPSSSERPATAAIEVSRDDLFATLESDRRMLIDFISLSPSVLSDLSVLVFDAKASGGARARDPLASYFLSTYVIDFGPVISGQTRKRSFRLCNLSMESVSLTIEKPKSLSLAGFSLEPDKLGKIPPASEGGSTRVDVSFLTKGQREGVLERDFIIRLRHCPPIRVVVRAEVIVPDVMLSTSQLSFGNVFCGKARAMYVRISNQKSLPFEWCIKPASSKVADKSADDFSHFLVSPMQGSLRSGEWCDVEFKVSPSRERAYNAKFVVHTSSSASSGGGSSRTVSCSAFGKEISVELDPTYVTFGCLQPFCSTDVEFSIVNHTSIPVEVYSLDFDGRYRSDDEIMRSNSLLASGSVLYIPVREPGESLPRFLVDDHEKSVQSVEEESSVPDADESSDPPAADDDVAVPSESFSNLEAREPFIAIVCGPPGCGSTTLATALAEERNGRYGCGRVHSINLEDLIDVALSQDASLYERARDRQNAIFSMRKAVSDSALDGGEGADKKGDKGKKKEAPPPKKKSGKPGDGGDPAPEVDVDSTRPVRLFADSIAEILYPRLLEADVSGGCFVEGIHSFHADSPLECVRAVAICASRLHRSFRALMVQLSWQSDLRRQIDREVSSARELIQTLSFSELNDEDYDNLTDEQRSVYDSRLRTWRDAMTKLRVAEKERSRFERDLERPSPSEDFGSIDIVPTLREFQRIRYDSREMEVSDFLSQYACADPLYDEEVWKGQVSLTPLVPVSESAIDSTLSSESASSSATPPSSIAFDHPFAIVLNGEATIDDLMHLSASKLPEMIEEPIRNPIPSSTDLECLALCRNRSRRPFPSGYSVLTPLPFSCGSLDEKVASISEQSHSPVALIQTSEHVEAEEGTEVEDQSSPVVLEDESLDQRKSQALYLTDQQTRWILPAHSSTKLFLRFSASEPGQYDHILSFAVVGRDADELSIMCSGHCAYPEISRDPRTVFYQKIRSRPTSSSLVSKKFILSEQIFDFGPLLCLKPPVHPGTLVESFPFKSGEGSANREIVPAHYSSNFDRIRVTNSGSFRCRVLPSFASGAPLEGPIVSSSVSLDSSLAKNADADVKKAAGGKKDKDSKSVLSASASLNAEEGNQHCFALFPPYLDLDPDESADFSLWAFPTRNGFGQDSILLSVDGCPSVSEFSLACVGCSPQINVVLPPLSRALDDVHHDVLPSGSSSESVLSLEERLRAGINFGRLMRSYSESSSFHLESSCDIPVRFELIGVDEFPQEFSIRPVSGILPARGRQMIFIDFHAGDPTAFELDVIVHVFDVEGIVETPCQVLQFPLVAESYAIDVTPSVSHVDFGTVKVVDGANASMCLMNSGKYPTQFRFSVSRRSPLYNVLSFHPNEGIIQPSGKSDGSASLSATSGGDDKKKKKPAADAGSVASSGLDIEIAIRTDRELLLRHAQDVRLFLFDAESSVTTEDAHIPVSVSVEAVFSKYSLLPSYGLNFGPVLFGGSKSKSFTLTNSGVFPFEFRAFRLADGLSSLSSGSALPGSSVADPKKDKKKEDKKKGRGDESSSVDFSIGPFSLRPSSSTLDPDESIEIVVQYHADGASTSQEIVGIDIADRDHVDHPSGIPFVLDAESVIPCLDTRGFDAIFEEHQVVQQLDVFSVERCIFALNQRVFDFGTILAHTSCSARVRLTNPSKLSAEIRLSLSPVQGAVAGAPANVAAGVHSAFPFSVEPSDIIIPPHEYRYVTIDFAPIGLESFLGKFEAIVTNGKQDHDDRLVFDVRGDGSLPRVAVVEPQSRSTDGSNYSIDFRRCYVGRSKHERIRVKNNGVLPATIRLDMVSRHLASEASSSSSPYRLSSSISGGPFIIPERSTEFFLTPGEEHEFVVEFSPSSAESFEQEVVVVVLDNPFEHNSVILRGIGYADDVSFEDLPGVPASFLQLVGSQVDVEDVLFVGSCPIGSSKEVVFTLSNPSPRDLRFEFDSEIPGFGNILFVEPSIGHLHSYSSKRIRVTFAPDSRLTLGSGVTQSADWLHLFTSTIEYSSSDRRDWDNSHRTLVWVDVDDMDSLLQEEKTKAESYLQQLQSRYDSMKSTASSAIAGSGAAGKKDKAPKKGAPDKDVSSAVSPSVRSADLLIDRDLRRAFESLSLASSKRIQYARVDEEPACVCSTDVSDVESQSHRKLLLSAISGIAKPHLSGYDSEEGVEFRPTLLFQSRSHALVLSNDGDVGFTFNSYITEDDGTVVTDDSCPYSISPSSGMVESGSSIELLVRFAPTMIDNDVYFLHVSIPGASSENISIEPVPLCGECLCPAVHFEIPFTSSYVHNPDLPGPFGHFGPIDSDVRVLEFESRGVKIRNTKRFYVLNPTAMSYEFVWENVDGNLGEIGGSSSTLVSSYSCPFSCKTLMGSIHSGKKFEVLFDFTPSSLDLVESFWRFSIPSLKISQLFLLVGRALEPSLSIDRTFVNFHHILLGARARQVVTLKNEELVPYAFSFDTKDLFSTNENQDPPLFLTPSSGVVPPESDISVEIVFCPREERLYNFNLPCRVKNKPSKVNLNVKGEGFGVHDSLHLIGSDKKVLDLSSQSTNYVDFGRIHVNETAVRKFVVRNSGHHPFDFSWSMPSSLPYLSLDPVFGSVSHGEEVECCLTFAPTREVAFDRSKVLCRVANGSSYSLQISGVASRPALHFSFDKYDFGPCFLSSKGAEPARAVLLVTNNDRDDVSFDMLPYNSEIFEVRAGACILGPGEHEEIEIFFHPSGTEEYSCLIPFEINGLYTVHIRLEGEGTIPKVDLMDPNQSSVAFGVARVNDMIRRSLTLVNRSKIPVSLELATESLSMMERNFISCSMLGVEVIRPRERFTVELVFSPNQRLHPFSDPLIFHIAGSRQVLSVVSGSCQGIEVKLESSSLAFGAAVLGTSVTRKLLIENTGDIGVRFEWTSYALEPDFTVSPAQGYCPAGSEVPIQITFTPSSVHPNIVYDRVPVYFEGYDTQYITLLGVCIDRPPESRTLEFRARVRENHLQKVDVQNPSDQLWVLRPVFHQSSSSPCWRAAESFEVRPKSSYSLEIIYEPLSMLHDGEQYHEGSCFIPLPDGSAMTIGLRGTPLEPDATAVVEKRIPCRKKTVFTFPLKNWLKHPQRFHVERDFQGLDHNDEEPFFVDGLDHVDVPGLMEREYRLTIVDYRVRRTNGRVRFVNEETGDYLFFDVKVDSVAADPLELPLEAPIRQKVYGHFLLENPLSVDVSFTVRCDHEWISIPNTVNIPARMAEEVRFGYRPLLPLNAPIQVPIHLQSAELGDYSYVAVLSCTQGGLEKSNNFRISLGLSTTQSVRWLSYAIKPTDYDCRLRSGRDVFVPTKQKVSSSADVNGQGVEVSVDVVFEPVEVGEFRDELIVSSAVGGEYIFPLSGHCIDPQPQGPITIRNGSSVQIPFKNVFSQQLTFLYQFDNPAFSVPKPSESIPAKKGVSIAVSYKSAPNLPSYGKLIVSVDGDPSKPSWLFYVRGD